MNINDIFNIIDKFENTSIAELKLNMEGVDLKLKKESACNAVCSEPKKSEITSAKDTTDTFNEVITQKSSADVTKKVADTVTNNCDEIKAPLVGTFYAAPSENDKPFVKVGDKVKKGDIVAIIEAMKLMNEITSPFDGEVVEVSAVNGEMVEYGQVLIKVKH